MLHASGMQITMPTPRSAQRPCTVSGAGVHRLRLCWSHDQRMICCIFGLRAAFPASRTVYASTRASFCPVQQAQDLGSARRLLPLRDPTVSPSKRIRTVFCAFLCMSACASSPSQGDSEPRYAAGPARHFGACSCFFFSLLASYSSGALVPSSSSSCGVACMVFCAIVPWLI